MATMEFDELDDLQDQIGLYLIDHGAATSAVLGKELGVAEGKVVVVLRQLQKDKFVTVTGGMWDVTDEYKKRP